MLSAMLAAKAVPKQSPFPILDLPVELVEEIVGRLGPEDQKAKKAARASCTQLRAAINYNVTSVKISSDMEGQKLPATLLPKLKTVTLDMSNGHCMGMWTAANLALLGIDGAPAECKIDVHVDAAIVHLDQLHSVLSQSGLLPRVRSLNHTSWGVQGRPAKFGQDVEVTAKLKLVRQECIDRLIHNTMEHDNLTSLCFAPMLRQAWNNSLVREINESCSTSLRSLVINFRPFQEVDLGPLAELCLPNLEHLELRAQNAEGFGKDQLLPLQTAKIPLLKSLVVEVTGESRIGHLGEFLRPLVQFTELESIDIWANRIESYAGLWGVGKGGIFFPKLHTLSLRVSPCSIHSPRSVFAANPKDVVDAFAGLTLDKLHLHDIGLPEEASASGISRLVLTNPRWEDLHVAMRPTFSPDLKVIRVCGVGARAIRAKILTNMIETPSLETGWRMGSPSQGNEMQKVRSFVVLHDLEAAKLP